MDLKQMLSMLKLRQQQMHQQSLPTQVLQQQQMVYQKKD